MLLPPPPCRVPHPLDPPRLLDAEQPSRTRIYRGRRRRDWEASRSLGDSKMWNARRSSALKYFVFSSCSLLSLSLSAQRFYSVSNTKKQNKAVRCSSQFFAHIQTRPKPCFQTKFRVEKSDELRLIEQRVKTVRACAKQRESASTSCSIDGH